MNSSEKTISSISITISGKTLKDSGIVNVGLK
jgi:hypothetical protein